MSIKKKSWIKNYAKVGYLSKGIVYILVGSLTAMTAIGIGGEKASNTDAMLQINSLPGGGFLLILLGLGLAGYSLLRLIQAIRDTENEGKEAKGIGKRIAYAFSGLVYASFAFISFKIAIGQKNSSSGGSKEKMAVAELLQKPFGKWIAIAIGLVMIGNGLYQIMKAYKGSFMKDINGLPGDQYRTLKKAGRAGFTARGIVFSIIGFLFVKAAWYNNPSSAEGTEGAFTFLQTSPFGSYLLGIVALGLVCYGLFMFVQAKYSNININ
jgi:hypothetical protein